MISSVHLHMYKNDRVKIVIIKKKNFILTLGTFILGKSVEIQNFHILWKM